MSAAHPVKPSYYGIVQTTKDALILFSACHDGNIPFVERRPTDRDRPQLICSGNVFIYCESRSNIKRWTDGVFWSPSRIMSNFLIYREIDKRFGDEKSKAKTAKPAHRRRSNSPPRSQDPTSMTRERERSLVGSLVDSYDFRSGGLVKKTISVSYGKTKYHLVSYYTVQDGLNGRLPQPSTDPHLMCQSINQNFIENTTWRIELDENGNELARDGTQYNRNSPMQPTYQSSHYDNGAGHDDSGHGHHDSYPINPDLNQSYHPSASSRYPYSGSHHNEYMQYSSERVSRRMFMDNTASHGTQMPPLMSHDSEPRYIPDTNRNYHHTSHFQPGMVPHAQNTQPRTIFPDIGLDAPRSMSGMNIPTVSPFYPTAETQHMSLPNPSPAQCRCNGCVNPEEGVYAGDQ